MTKGRLEAFSDGVFAIIITITVLELQVPEGSDLAALVPLLPIFFSYILSFVFLGIYWNNHHHLLQAAKVVNGRILWANMHLLFWLSLIPFVTGWMGKNKFASLPVALYSIDLIMAAFAYFLLAKSLIKLHGEESAISRAIGSVRKERLSLIGYAFAIPLAFMAPGISMALILLVAIIWLIPDRRIENYYASERSISDEQD